ncbi:thioredoxin-dependent thiol peroxidase [Marinimicrobium sp. ABcell2]|uniref:thioredoxin-dependent thiol peroxidase n=1 Tax=Marinimicrobium sp. ABcell2 TaxID=3069751 RepID=UPI0027B6997A|nr:thioredoxin-dependent thiol peroxidase [Marinimicrobium sp. ABcell2]MDQ2075657.1 thioredoxin-dependent thiol peroxidase [Marinimicrobium sp. ABcell2]
MAFPKIGNLAPAFSLQNQNGETVSLKDFKGKKNVVLYFYPKASTPGCTTQACGLRDAMTDLAELDTVVLGVSPDQPPALQKFIDKKGLNFDLLSDPDHAVADKYGAWGPKKFMGREYDGILRTSFLIDKQGKLRHILDKVKTKTHDQDVLAYLREHF